MTRENKGEGNGFISQTWILNHVPKVKNASYLVTLGY